MTSQTKQKGCCYALAFRGECGAETPKGGEFCVKHFNTVCECCFKKATRECAETFIHVCGTPLCDNCEHVLIDSATGKHEHRKKQSVAL